MKTVNILEFINSTSNLYALAYSKCSDELVNFLDLLAEDEQFTQKINLGIIYVNQKTINQFTIVDGLARILSLMLLLHAVCECYKKTTSRNENAINTIRSKYLLDGNKTKLRLPEAQQIIFDKIIFGERLSGKEKKSSMFNLLHHFWSQIKEEKLQAAKIFKMLQKVNVNIVDIDEVPARDVFYTLNKDKRELNQIKLISSYLKNYGINDEWEDIVLLYDNVVADITLFFKDYFITKFNFKEFSYSRLYEHFVNYFETMLQYMSEDVLMAKIKRAAILYRDILNINIQNEALRHHFIQLKLHKGEDTYPYLLNIYHDYLDELISEATFVEILTTIDEYLKNRLNNPSDVSFNELVQYLNAFIVCK